MAFLLRVIFNHYLIKVLKRAILQKSIFVAVVNQTIAGLAQGREIAGKIVYLGGPLTFFA